MSGSIKIYGLVILSVIVILLGVLLVKTTEGAGKPTEIPLRAIFENNEGNNKILNDPYGPYENGKNWGGGVFAKILDPNKQGGRFYMSIDNGGVESGRFISFILDDLRQNCSACNGKDNPAVPADFPIGTNTPINTRSVVLCTFGDCEGSMFYNFRTMALNIPHYVAMRIEFRITKTDGMASDTYYLGSWGAVVEVTALAASSAGEPTEWIIKSVTPEDTRFSDCPGCPMGHYRDLIREFSSRSGKRVTYTSNCYGWFYIPFTLHLYSMQ